MNGTMRSSYAGKVVQECWRRGRGTVIAICNNMWIFQSAGPGLKDWQIAVISKNYRRITSGTDGANWDSNAVRAFKTYPEDDVMFYNAIGRYGEPGMGTNEFIS